LTGSDPRYGFRPNHAFTQTVVNQHPQQIESQTIDPRLINPPPTPTSRLTSTAIRRTISERVGTDVDEAHNVREEERGEEERGEEERGEEERGETGEYVEEGGSNDDDDDGDEEDEDEGGDEDGEAAVPGSNMNYEDGLNMSENYNSKPLIFISNISTLMIDNYSGFRG
jgi:hypothetical protein